MQFVVLLFSLLMVSNKPVAERCEMWYGFFFFVALSPNAGHGLLIS